MCEIADWIALDLPHGACLTPRLALRHGRDQVASAVAQGGWEAFERPLPAVFYRAAASWPGLVLDVGANTGFYTLLAAAAHRRNRVLAFEPVPEVLALLDENVRASAVQDRVRLIRCAVSDGNGGGVLYLPDADHGLVETSASLRADFKARHAGTIPVLRRTLDRVLFRPSLVMRRVSLIKIDVEGCEAPVLRGAHWTIMRHRPIVFVEVLFNADLAALDAFLVRHRYGAVRLRSDGTHGVGGEIVQDDQALNQALVPRERLDDFMSRVVC